jgi:S1-C subfamily serine protease
MGNMNACCAEEAGKPGIEYTGEAVLVPNEPPYTTKLEEKKQEKEVETYVEKVVEKVEEKVEQAVKAVEEKAAEEFGLKFQFLKSKDAKDTADSRVTLYAKVPQIGMAFVYYGKYPQPIVINRVDDGLWAKSAGVEVGWVIVSCADKEIADFKEFEDAQQFIVRQVTELRSKEECGLKFQFIKSASAKDEVVTLYAKKGPLGFAFANSMPVTINNVTDGSWAHTVGVQCGWVLVSVMDKPMSDFKEFKDAQEHLIKQSKLLG